VLETFFFAPTNEHEMRRIILELDSKNAPGWDGISLISATIFKKTSR